jgi:hypothetical protein
MNRLPSHLLHGAGMLQRGVMIYREVRTALPVSLPFCRYYISVTFDFDRF